MTLPFSTTYPATLNNQLAGKRTYFPEKIWKGLDNDSLLVKIIGVKEAQQAEKKYFNTDNFKVVPLIVQKYDWEGIDHFKPKLHTFREDPLNRWKAGRPIHFAINNRTKNHFQFAPIIPCVSTQRIDIQIVEKNKEGQVTAATITIDNKYFGSYFYYGDMPSHADLLQLAHNDGFDTLEDFFAYFHQDFKGKIIHWTDLKY